MLQRIKKYFFSSSHEPLEYTPVKHIFFRNKDIANALHEKGYYVVDFLGETERQQLLDTYEKYHKIKDDGRGAFFGEMSVDIHYTIEKILRNSLDKWFINYKTAVNGFVVKTPGELGNCPIHQDAADIDELQYSSINIWIPLQTMNPVNGTLYIVPRSNHIFVPYRAATIDALTKDIEDLISPYFIPLYLELGQALFFDVRAFHHSPPNLSDKIRLVTVSRIFPKEASLITYFKEHGAPGSPIEMFRCPDDYVVHSTPERDRVRPKNCESLGFRYTNTNPLTAKEFDKRRKKVSIQLNPSPFSR